MTKLRILVSDLLSSWAALATTAGTRMSTTSRVMAMAKTASLKNSTRSYSRFPATESGFSALRPRCAAPSAPIGGSAAPVDGSPPSVIASRTFHP